MIEAYPTMVELARANRAFLGRAVSYLAAQAGIRQFLDIGAGIPTAGNTHHVAQQIAPDSRVVYVDYDPVVLSHARALLASSPQGATDFIDADARDVETVLGYLTITHPAADIEPEKVADVVARLNKLSFQQYTARSRAQVMRFFDGLEMVEPGLVQVQRWRPATPTSDTVAVWAGVGSK